MITEWGVRYPDGYIHQTRDEAIADVLVKHETDAIKVCRQITPWRWADKDRPGSPAPQEDVNPEKALERQGFFKVADTPMTMSGYPDVPYIGYRCPACGGVHPDSPHMTGTGHTADCWLDARLKENS